MVLVAVPRVSRSCEHFPDGSDLHLIPLLCEAPIQLGLVCKIFESLGQDGFENGREWPRAVFGLWVWWLCPKGEEGCRAHRWYKQHPQNWLHPFNYTQAKKCARIIKRITCVLKRFIRILKIIIRVLFYTYPNKFFTGPKTFYTRDGLPAPFQYIWYPQVGLLSHRKWS